MNQDQTIGEKLPILGKNEQDSVPNETWTDCKLKVIGYTYENKARIL